MHAVLSLTMMPNFKFARMYSRLAMAEVIFGARFARRSLSAGVLALVVHAAGWCSIIGCRVLNMWYRQLLGASLTEKALWRPASSTSIVGAISHDRSCVTANSVSTC
jgi:hypothetical protein